MAGFEHSIRSNREIKNFGLFRTLANGRAKLRATSTLSECTHNTANGSRKTSQLFNSFNPAGQICDARVAIHCLFVFTTKPNFLSKFEKPLNSLNFTRFWILCLLFLKFELYTVLIGCLGSGTAGSRIFRPHF